jgi:hypothetical protein
LQSYWEGPVRELCETKTTGKRKSPRGTATNDLVFSAYAGNNHFVFSRILDLYVTSGAAVADITYGNGAFWKDVDLQKYTCAFSDIKSNVDCRALPYKPDSYDCVVFDPPYMHVSGGSAHVNHQNYEQYYQNNINHGTMKKYHEAVLDLYFRTAREAFRVLKRNGIFIVKCQDEVCSNRQRLTHVEIINELTVHNYVCEDLFVVMRTNKPGMSRVIKQRHARKNHSYFLVFRKR